MLNKSGEKDVFLPFSIKMVNFAVMKPKKILKIIFAIALSASMIATTNEIVAKKTNTTQTLTKSTSKKSGGKSAGTAASSKSGKQSSKSSVTATGKSSGATASKSSASSSRYGRGSKNSSSRKSSSYGKGSSTYSTYTKPKSTPSEPKETVSNDSLTLSVNTAIIEIMPKEVNPGGLRVNLVKPEDQSKKIQVQLNENFTYLPLNRELINKMEKTVKNTVPDSISNYSISLNVGSRPLSSYITTIDKLPEKYRQNENFVVEVDPMAHAKRGMEGDIVALWHSHGRYFKNGSWAWQRPFLFDTAEDIYTMGYVLPFLVPMLENAGAYVMLPRERDINVNEVIVDNDQPMEGEMLYSQTTYRESEGSNRWEDGEYDGFIYDVKEFHDTENPFESGSYRQVGTVKGGKASTAGWFADIPEDGDYAVYVSYKSLPNSSEDAHYTVNYDGGYKEFRVNQKMGGGTWIYLGTFPLKKGYNSDRPVVSLNNLTSKGGNTVVTADAVKIGGGMGNIGRSTRRSDVKYYYEEEEEVAEEPQAKDAVDQENSEDVDGEMTDGEAEPAVAETPKQTTKKSKGAPPKFSTSRLPRFLEGARYWLHWAGMPEHVYSPYHGNDDYKDDYTSRGLWVNYLAGGSRVLPNAEGLHIPVDISFALHTDAGKRNDDSIVGTLGIYYTDGGKSYADGTPRMNSRILTDMIMRQVVGDVRQSYEPNWTRRSMWDKAYLEAKTPQVPSTLLELLSHQNFGDMQYGLDPTFRFTVCRAIYKAMGRFISARKNRDFVVQPLPVNSFSIDREKKGVYRLSWLPTEDTLEPTAKPAKYIIMERREGYAGFVKIAETRETHYSLKVGDNNIHSLYIVAANEGGVSFPSEILSLREGGSQKPILIVNGFTRVSGPKSFTEGNKAGFKAEEDFGVPYKYDISFSGYQTEFSRGAGDRFGWSGSNHVATIAGGNTFDYPAVHGDAIAASGHGFVSTSLKAVEDGRVKLSNYSAVDLILGKQKATVTGKGRSGKRFEIFSKALKDRIDPYIEKGGKLIVSGQNIVSELLGSQSTEDDKIFASWALGLAETIDPPARTKSGKLKVTGMSGDINGLNVPYSNTLRQDYYIVEAIDALTPEEDPDVKATPFLTFSDSGDAAGLMINNGKAREVVMSVPFESITDQNLRRKLMGKIIEFLNL